MLCAAQGMKCFSVGEWFPKHVILIECCLREPDQYVVNEVMSAGPGTLIMLVLKSYQAGAMYLYSLLG